MVIKPGLCFLDSTVPGQKRHLHVVLTGPNANNEVVVVSITTRRGKSDCTTILKSGEHPFIKHDSVIAYSAAKIYSIKHLETVLSLESYVIEEDMDKVVLKRIQDDAANARHMTRSIRNTWYEFDI